MACSVNGTRRATSGPLAPRVPMTEQADRKSTRLNSSHITTSHAVFCFHDRAAPPLSTLPLHDALPIYPLLLGRREHLGGARSGPLVQGPGQATRSVAMGHPPNGLLGQRHPPRHFRATGAAGADDRAG